MTVSFSQAKSEETNTSKNECFKVAVINTMTFYDKEKGIKKLVQAENLLGFIEYFEIHSLTKRIEKLENEIHLLQSQGKSVEEKNAELKGLKEELKLAWKQKKAEIERKTDILVKPVIDEIAVKLEEFAKLKGYTVVLDLAKSKSILVVTHGIDITVEFIQFCNDHFDKEKT